MWKDSHRTSTKCRQISDFHKGKRVSTPLSRTKEKGERSRMGPSLLGASCAGGQVSASPRKTRGAGPARRGLGPRPAARPSRRHSSGSWDSSFPAQIQGGLGLATLTPVVHHTERAREDAQTHQQSKAPLPGAQRKMCATAVGASFSRQGTTHPLPHKFLVRLSLPSWTPELAGAAAVSLGVCMGPGAWTLLQTGSWPAHAEKRDSKPSNQKQPSCQERIKPTQATQGRSCL